MIMSHPTRGAWIEIITLSIFKLKVNCRTPPGVRGLKYNYKYNIVYKIWSHPTRGAWIEMIRTVILFLLSVGVAPHPGCVD